MWCLTAGCPELPPQGGHQPQGWSLPTQWWEDWAETGYRQLGGPDLSQLSAGWWGGGTPGTSLWDPHSSAGARQGTGPHRPRALSSVKLLVWHLRWSGIAYCYLSCSLYIAYIHSKFHNFSCERLFQRQNRGSVLHTPCGTILWKKALWIHFYIH